MEIKELETLLSVSRSNIRFYEKEGLLRPERRENGYRAYSDGDVAMLKKILVLRKLGCSIEEIAAMQRGELPLSGALEGTAARLEEEIGQLTEALELAKRLSAEDTTFDAMDQERYWAAISQAESRGAQFADLCRDCAQFELGVFDGIWRHIFFHDFKGSRKRYGVPAACGILLLLCVVRGVARVLWWHESFWSGFLYPFAIFLAASAILLPVYLLGKKAPKAASAVSTGLLILGGAVIAAALLFIVYGVIRSLLSL